MRKLLISISIQAMISLSSLFSYSQSTFTYLVSTLNYECIFDGTEDELGNYYMVGRKYYDDPFTDPAYLLVLNADGQLVYEHEFYNEDTSSYFGSVYFKNDSIVIIGAKGLASSELKNELWLLIFDNNFNVLKNKTFSLDNYGIGDIETLINRKGNYVICGNVDDGDIIESDIFLFEISSSGDSVNRAIIPIDGMQVEFDLIEKPEGGYKVFAYGNFPGVPNTIPGKIVEFDSMFNYISADSIPYNLRNNHSAKWLNDSVYMVTGEKQVDNFTRTDNAIIKLKADDEFITGNHFGKSGDTITYVGACSNLDFIDHESIFFGGASDIHPQQGLYQPDSWLILDNLDSNLNLNWQRFYGGDAGYYLWGLKATQDGGCLMMATRYDADIQDQELDIYILKVDTAGLLTSTGEGPQIPVQQLAIVPNPALDNVSIRYPDIFGYDDKEIEIYNSQGLPVITQSAKQDLSETRVNVSSLPAGLYYVLLKVDWKKVATGKMVKI
jgi:hypothetical protein